MKQLILAMLAQRPTHGYELLQAYDRMFSAVLPPLNAGQIYTTLSRLERDGMVEDHTVEQENKPDKRVYQITDLGMKTLQDWFNEPMVSPRIKDDLYLKLISASITQLAEPQQIITEQRQEYLQALHELTTLALEPEVKTEPVRQALVHGAILHLKADLEWLDLCERIFTEGVNR